MKDERFVLWERKCLVLRFRLINSKKITFYIDFGTYTTLVLKLL